MSGNYPENFYSQDPPPSWQQGPPQQPYGYGQQQQYQQPYPQGEKGWEQRPYGSPAPYGEQRSGSPYESRGTFAPPPPQYDGQQQFQGQHGPNGERGIGASLAGAAAGGFLGHEMKGGAVADIGGAIIGAIAANAFEKHHKKKKAEKKARNAYDDGYVNGEQRDMGHGSRSIDGYEEDDEEYEYDDRPRHHHHHHDDRDYYRESSRDSYRDGSRDGHRRDDYRDSYRGDGYQDSYRGDGYRDQYQESSNFRQQDFNRY